MLTNDSVEQQRKLAAAAALLLAAKWPGIRIHGASWYSECSKGEAFRSVGQGTFLFSTSKENPSSVIVFYALDRKYPLNLVCTPRLQSVERAVGDGAEGAEADG